MGVQLKIYLLLIKEHTQMVTYYQSITGSFCIDFKKLLLLKKFLRYTATRGSMVDLLDVKIDVVFKEFFGDKSNKGILEHFINTVLELEDNDTIEVLEFLDPRLSKAGIEQPQSFVDLYVKTKGGEYYILEMQTYYHEGFDKRVLYYLSKEYCEHLGYFLLHGKKKVGWHKLPIVHAVAIVDFHRNNKQKDGVLNSDDVVEHYVISPQKSHLNNHLFRAHRASVIDLTKFKPEQSIHEGMSHRDIWLSIIGNASSLSQQERILLKDHDQFSCIMEKLEMLSANGDMRKRFEASFNALRDHNATIYGAESQGREEGIEIGREIGREEGREIGREEGAREEKRKIARGLLDSGMDINKVSEITGLTAEQIDAEFLEPK